MKKDFFNYDRWNESGEGAIFLPLISRKLFLGAFIIQGLFIGWFALMGPATLLESNELVSQKIYQELMFSVDVNDQSSRSAFPVAYSISNHLAIMFGFFSGIIGGFVKIKLLALQKTLSSKSTTQRVLRVICILIFLLFPIFLVLPSEHFQPSFQILETIRTNRGALFVWAEAYFLVNFLGIFHCISEISQLLLEKARHAN